MAGRLEFEAPDHDRFPCLRLAYRALEAGDAYPVVLNAANEVAVASFLAGSVPFPAIADGIAAALDEAARQGGQRPDTLAAIRELDAWAPHVYWVQTAGRERPLELRRRSPTLVLHPAVHLRARRARSRVRAGHFLLARWHGVRVLTFSLGFGPKLVQVHARGQSDNCVLIIPLGGFVKMAGETPDDDTPAKADEFFAKSKWQRFQIYIAGPAMNVLAAFLIMIGVYGANEPSFSRNPVEVGRVIEASSV